MKRRPVFLMRYIAFSNKDKAFEFEKYLKTGAGREFLNKRILGEDLRQGLTNTTCKS